MRSSTLQAILLLPLFLSFMHPANGQCKADSSSLSGSGVWCNGNQMNIGIPVTNPRQVYTWKRKGKPVYGPISGNGSNLSYQFTLSSPSEAGHYTVVTYLMDGGCDSAEFGNVDIYYAEPVKEITPLTIEANSATITWKPVAPGATYQYAVSTDSSEPDGGVYTTDLEANLRYLSGGVTYYFFVRVVCGFGSGFTDWARQSFVTLPGPCSSIPGTLSGGGSFCMGSSVSISIPNSIYGQRYTWLKDGSQVYNADGTNGTLSYNFVYNSAAQIGHYTAVASKDGCLDAPFGDVTLTNIEPVKGITLSSVTEISALFSWKRSGDRGVQYQYGVTTTPDPATIPFYYSPSDTIGFVDDLQPDTKYYVYVRSLCSFNQPMAPDSISFTTRKMTPPDCGKAVAVGECTLVSAAIPAGGGGWRLSGSYPVNSVGGNGAKGKEMLFTFTPAATAVYYLDNSTSTASNIAYYYKPMSGGCVDTGWVGIGTSFSNGHLAGKLPIGWLQAGTTYLLLLDNMVSTADTDAFKICRATVTSPSLYNVCNDNLYYYTGGIYGYDPKEEFILDNNGNVIASLDFSALHSDHPGVLSISRFVKSLPLRRTANNEEYMDQSLTLSQYNYMNEPVRVRLFFSNTELDQLTSQPKDGVGDAYSLADLHIVQVSQDCLDVLVDYNDTLTIAPRSAGAYDPASSCIQFDALLPYYGPVSFFIKGGCPSSAAISSAGDRTTVCQDNDLVLTSSFSQANQWYKDGQVIPGATSGSYAVKTPGSYTVRLSNPSGCYVESPPFVVTEGAVPDPPVITAGGATVLCMGDSVRLSSSHTSGNTWYKDGVQLPSSWDQFCMVKASGNYTVRVAGDDGCTAVSQALSVTVKPLPPKPGITQSGGSLLSDQLAGNQWYLNGTPVPGAVLPTYHPIASGMYSDRITLQGCTGPVSDAINFVYTATSDPNALENIISIYPNPVSDKLYIFNKTFMGVHFEMYDLSGRRVGFSGTGITGTYEIKMQSLASGCYVLLVSDDHTKQSLRKLVWKK